MKENAYDVWPALPYAEFSSTLHLLHMLAQMLGKIKLHTPFESHWANVALWLTSSGITTGIIPYKKSVFSISVDFIDHVVKIHTSSNDARKFDLETMSVAQLYKKFLEALQELEINLSINPTPQEILNPIPFDKDTQAFAYDKKLANHFWKILLNAYCVMQRFHAHFDGETPSIGLMWGTFDLRDVRYNGIQVPTTGINAGFIRRNAMNEAQFEIGWWPGNEAYPRPAFFSYVYPQPQKIEKAKIKPDYARWDNTLSLFILDYDDLRKSPELEKDLYLFFESTYSASTELAKWNPNLITTGEPV